MDKGPTNEQLGRLRWLSIIAGGLLFVADYGFAATAKQVPSIVYGVLAAIALGVDIKRLRSIIVTMLVGKKQGDDDDDI